ncbi:unnamed protein product [Hymenolepis diminuta]|uniref:Uncharacterized protein n=1 Tax=Hymenolepis diminuta TaxID=6216 RepID=A0A564YV68_HYMDI|nr:unnamed protein product [Hymenolepis diminuta]
MSKRVHRFTLFSNNCLASHKRHICVSSVWPRQSKQLQPTLVSEDSYTSCSSPLFLTTLLSLSLPHCYSFRTRSGFLEYIFGLLNS